MCISSLVVPTACTVFILYLAKLEEMIKTEGCFYSVRSDESMLLVLKVRETFTHSFYQRLHAWIPKVCVYEERKEELSMLRTWQTDEVIRCLADADQDELQDLIEDAGDEAAEVGTRRKRSQEPLWCGDAFRYWSQSFVRSRWLGSGGRADSPWCVDRVSRAAWKYCSILTELAWLKTSLEPDLSEKEGTTVAQKHMEMYGFAVELTLM